MGFKKMWDSLWHISKSASNFASHWHTVGAILESLFGKEPAADAKPSIKGLYGLFGMKDEKEWLKLLWSMDPDTKYEKRNAQVILAFVEWQFPRMTLEQRLVAAYYGNKFRIFILTIGSEHEKKHFLGEMVNWYFDADDGFDAGVKNIRRELLRRHVPLPPDNAEDALIRARAALPEFARDAYIQTRDGIQAEADRVNERVAELRRTQPSNQRIVKKMRLF